jgi:AcrR family transcriptional regulator
MARPRTLDREHLLDVAEELVAESNAANLTFGSLATAANVPKASIQSAFGTRQGLIDAMLERWIKQEKARFEAAVGEAPSRRERIGAHIKITAEEPAEANSRVASLLATLAGSGEQSESVANWYDGRIGSLTARGADERKQRIAFLAAEGAFYMRHVVGYEISDKLWAEIFRDLRVFVAE